MVRERAQSQNMFVIQTERQPCNRSLNWSRLVILHSPADLDANEFAESLSPLAVFPL